MNQPRCPRCGELEVHSALRCVGTIMASTGGDPVYITASPPAPGPVSVPSVWVATCPTCGQLMPGSTPASYDASGDRGAVPGSAPVSEDAFDPDHLYHAPPAPVKDTNVAHEAPPSGWREREPLL